MKILGGSIIDGHVSSVSELALLSVPNGRELTVVGGARYYTSATNGSGGVLLVDGNYANPIGVEEADDFEFLNTVSGVQTVTRGARTTRRLIWNSSSPIINIDGGTFTTGDTIELSFLNTSGVSTITNTASTLYAPDGTDGSTHTFTGNGVITVCSQSSDNALMITSVST